MIDSESDGDDVFSGQEESIEVVSDNEPGNGDTQTQGTITTKRKSKQAKKVAKKRSTAI